MPILCSYCTWCLLTRAYNCMQNSLLLVVLVNSHFIQVTKHKNIDAVEGIHNQKAWLNCCLNLCATFGERTCHETAVQP